MIILLVVSLEILQEINTMKLIWAFKFSKSKDPATKQDKVYDLDDLVKVSCPSVCCGCLSRFNRSSPRVS